MKKRSSTLLSYSLILGFILAANYFLVIHKWDGSPDEYKLNYLRSILEKPYDYVFQIPKEYSGSKELENLFRELFSSKQEGKY
jgi:hypothetical protein